MHKIQTIVALLLLCFCSYFTFGMSQKRLVEVMKKTNNVMFDKCERREVRKVYGWDFVEKVDNAIMESYKIAWSGFNAYKSDNLTTDPDVRHRLQDKNYLEAGVYYGTFTFPVIVSDAEFKEFVNKAYERKLSKTFSYLELYYANVIYNRDLDPRNCISFFNKLLLDKEFKHKWKTIKTP